MAAGLGWWHGHSLRPMGEEALKLQVLENASMENRSKKAKYARVENASTEKSSKE